MEYFCKELNRTFTTKELMFTALRAVKSDLIAQKKAQVFKSCEKGLGITAKPLSNNDGDLMIKDTDMEKALRLDDDFYHIAVNSTRILDTHQDLHLDGIWNKTKKEQQGKNYLLADHDLKMDKTIVKKEHIKMMIATIPFLAIGKSYSGETQVLIYKFRKDKVINEVAKTWLESGDAIEASVRMQYTEIIFAVDSDAEEDKKGKKAFDDLFPLIANIDDFEEEITHFWGIKQAKNLLESSLVLFGSNGATGQITIEQKKEPVQSTPEVINEPSEDTQKRNYLLNLLN